MKLDHRTADYAAPGARNVSTENHMLMPSMCQVKRQTSVTHEMCDETCDET